MAQVELVRVSSDDWEVARSLRLEMLADSPRSFETQLDDVEPWTDERWRAWMRSATLDDSIVVAAVTDDGRWVGQASGRLFDGRPYAIAVYVTPTHRGRGLAAQLVGRVAEWARGLGHDHLYLDVHEDAAPARASYERQGFEYTGGSVEHSRYPGEFELEMRLPLT